MATRQVRRRLGRKTTNAASALPPLAGWYAACLAWARRYGWLFAVAFGLRLAYPLSIRHAVFFTHLQTEPLRYRQWADLIARGRLPPPPYDEPPGYPLFLAAVYACGGGRMAVSVAQGLLGAFTCIFVTVAGSRWFGRSVGVLAGVFAAIYGPFIYFGSALLPTALFVCLATGAMAAALSAAPGPSWGLSGCLWAASIAVRPQVLLAFPCVFIDAWRRGGRLALRRTAAPIALVLAGFLALNAAFTGRLVLLTTSGGLNLWLGNSAFSDGVSPFVSGDAEAFADGVRARAVDAVTADRRFAQAALAFWQHAPLQGLRLLWKKFVWTWVDRELPNSSDIGWETAHSWLFRSPLFPLRLGMVLPFALAGALLLGTDWRRLVLLAALPTVGIGTCVVFITDARFRLIMAPALVILAAFGVVRTYELMRTRPLDGRRLLVAAAGLVVGTVAAWGNFYGVRTYRIPQLVVNAGILEREAGQFEAAVHHLRQGLALHPRDGIAWVHLALALEQEGRPAAALQAYLDASALLPDDPAVREMSGRFFARYGLDPALRERYVAAATPAARAAVGRDARTALARAAGEPAP
jgi:tetratricopeptide (TPR) repeat protein